MNAATKIETPKGLDLLRQPFPAHQISKLPKGGVMLDYVGHAALTDRLLEADPHWNWEPLAFTPEGLPKFDDQGGLWIKLTICGVTRLGYGDAGGKKGTNAIKEAIGDALRNSGMRFGAALDLWHKGELHVDEAAGGHSEGSEVSPPPANLIDDAQWSELVQLVEATGTDAAKLCGAYNVASFKELRPEQAIAAKAILSKRLAAKAKEAENA